MLEEKGIMSPVLGVSCKYKRHVTFGDTIQIETSIKIGSILVSQLLKQILNI